MTQLTMKNVNVFCAGACFAAGMMSLMLATLTGSLLGYLVGLFCLGAVGLNFWVCWRWL